ncbi:antibiotic biosynthesis monooxygenase [Lysobacter sp. A6]|uniref:Antibiotic biosynthesis monooxygenase n=1 Tax=Noviluteimonas lactosilytica TaxID=2888523 RepID=A0ABS8JGK9_9GAMM|nr:antibiotic biosynthesis monooxygenase [Lysobacter lactosilyticus]MCC8362623.1 antibiotic biosynthesis monooxygenase [Lysobacter lactosilyticus]
MTLPPGFAALPDPPYYAVIFSSLRNGEDEPGYAEAADRMLALAEQQPGYLGAETVRGSDGFGITVSYWASEAAISAWKHQADHAATRAHGRNHWYAHFELRVAKVERAYGKPTRG